MRIEINERIEKLKKSYLPYMIPRFIELLGTEEELIKLLEFNERPLKPTIRFNSLRAKYSRIYSLLKNKGVILEDVKGLRDSKRVIKSKVPIGATPEYLNGYYMLQGKNSLYPPLILNPKTNDLVADLAAAPGGKTTYLAQLMENTGNIVAVEVSKKRCKSLMSNLSRMGVSNSTVFNMSAENINKLNLKFDSILLDAPCSGSGIIVSDPSRKTSKTMKDIIRYSRIQTQLLTAAIKALKIGGTMVYCTCSLEPEENELVISEVLKTGTIELLPINYKGDPGLTAFQDYEFNSELERSIRLYPHKTNGEGFFIAKMVKNDEI